MYPFKDRVVAEGTRVFVYFNLHKYMFSVKALEGEFEGQVVMHADTVFLKGDCSFSVSKAGRDRVRRTRQKNVHAGVIGNLSFSEVVVPKLEVSYNPYLYDTFVLSDTKNPIHKANGAILKDKKVFIS